MTKFSQGILEGFSGKTGNVIGGSWKGVDYMRSKPNKVNNPNTQAQQTQRSKFGLIMGFLTEINRSFGTRIQIEYQTSDCV